jgi:RimJ/RimL family protein N-acetyltransferase
MMTLERAGSNDAPALLAAKADAFACDVALYGYGPPGYDSPEDISAAIRKPENRYFKILKDGALAGGLCACDMGGGRFHINSLYIFTALQSGGAGTEAMRLLFDRFPEVARWTLETPYLSLRNHHFYEKLGFVKTGETEPGPDGFYLFLYEKSL